MENPYESPAGGANVEKRPRRRYWLLGVYFPGMIVAAIPFYGYTVRAGHNSQLTALVIILCWLLTWLFAAGAIAIASPTTAQLPLKRRIAISAAFFFVFAVAFGWGGVRHAFIELIAG